MRVCTLQFAPQPGEIESNTSRASCLIADLQPGSLDLLVLPELALTGEHPVWLLFCINLAPV